MAAPYRLTTGGQQSDSTDEALAAVRSRNTRLPKVSLGQ